MTVMAAVVQLATGAPARALAVSVLTSLAQSAVLAFVTRAVKQPAPAAGSSTRLVPARRLGAVRTGTRKPGPRPEGHRMSKRRSSRDS